MGFNLAVPWQQIKLTKFGGLFTNADSRNLPPGGSPLCYDCDFRIGGVTVRPGLSRSISTYSPTLPANDSFQFLRSFTLPSGLKVTIAQDSAGGLWLENLTGEGTMTRFYSGILNSARALGAAVNNRAYLPLSNLVSGSDQPRQYDGTYLDRISQVGPGQAPSPPTIGVAGGTILSVTPANPSVSVYEAMWGAQLVAPADAVPPGNVLFILFTPATTGNLNGLAPGDTVYLSGLPLMGLSTSGQGQNPNGTYVVTGTGAWNSGAGLQEYFTVSTQATQGIWTSAGLSGAAYQVAESLLLLTAGTILSISVATDAEELPSSFVLSGSGLPQSENTFPTLHSPSAGSINITNTSLASNVATYTYGSVNQGWAPGWQASFSYNRTNVQVCDNYGHVWAVTTVGVSGSSIPSWPASPTAGATQTDNTVVWTYIADAVIPATVRNTTNGAGVFNVTQSVITSADATTFTVALTNSDVASAAESGAGALTGYGNAYILNVGATTVGTGNPGISPIIGTLTTGIASPIVETGIATPTGTNSSSAASDVSAGQRYAICMFLTRNGFITPASPPVGFVTSTSSQTLNFANLPIGPPNVIARIVAITAANSGIGGPYYWVPNEVTTTALSGVGTGATVTGSATIVNDNTSTDTGYLALSDTVLLASINVSTTGNNLQQTREIGECVKVTQFAGRCFYSGERVKVDQFSNLTFDGGAVASFPAGWTSAAGTDLTASLITSPIFGQSLKLANTSGATVNATGTTLAAMLNINQGAFQTFAKTPIIQPNSGYGVRVTAWVGASQSAGSLVVELYSPSLATSWSLTVALSSMGTAPLEFTGALSNPLWQSPPADLSLRVYPTNFANDAVVNVDRIELYPVATPVYSTQLGVSYAANPEQVDSITGAIDISLFTSEAITNHFVFLNTLYITTASRTFSVAQETTEPAFWVVNEISNRVGCVGPLAVDTGEEYVLVGAPDGLYLFDGGNHIKVSQDIQDLWRKMYWQSAASIWVKNDIEAQRVYVGVPMVTPNQWLPLAPASATPATPNTVLMCNYLTAPTGATFATDVPVSVSMFTGMLLFRDERRKWAPWAIASPYADFIVRADGTRPLWLGGSSTSQIYLLDQESYTDDGVAINQTHMSYAFADAESEQMLRLGSVRKVYGFASVQVEGNGKMLVSTYPETPNTPYADTQPAYALVSPALDDTNVPMNEVGNRMFIQFATDGAAGSWFAVNQIVLGVIPSRVQVSGR